MISKVRGVKFICVILAMILILPSFACATSSTEEGETKIVRVGYMMYDGYQDGEQGEAKSGSAYEYYQRIRFYTDWEYEYVYGSISEMFDKLDKGEIDIMACVNYSEARAEKYLFSEESHGIETYFLYTHADNTEISPANLKSLDGKNVGVTLGSYQEVHFRQWCKDNNINCNIVTYDYLEDLRDALTDKEVDATVDVRMFGEENKAKPWKSIYRFGADPLYFAVNKERPDILEELNDAQAYIVSIDEYYSYSSMKKYHDGVNYQNVYLTPGQEKYLLNHATLKVGYLEGTNPLSFTNSDTGELDGLCAEYLEIMTEAYGVQFETYVYRDENSMIEDLRLKKIDIIFPLGMGYWAAEQRDVALSTSICSLPMTAIYMDMGTNATFEKVVVIKNSPTQEGYVSQFYPDAEICYVEGTKEALDAVEKGEADVYFARSSSLEYMNQRFRLYDRFRTMSVRNDMEAFMATRTEDTILSIILDKGISLLTDTQKDSAKFRYTYTIRRVSLWQAIKDNMDIVIGICIIVILLFVVIIVVLRLQSNKKHMKLLVAERDKAKKAEQAKTEFLSQMSHDIRTPMNAIIGFTNFIKEENDLEKIKEDYVPKIEMSSNHLLMLINDVLEMSRIETGKLVFQRSICDIRSIIESVLHVMRIQAEKKNIKLTTDIQVEGQLLKCDQTRISRVIINLLSNAVKFTPEGGRVSVSVHQKPNAPKGYASFEIKVSDTGIGMSPEFLEKVFEPFERERTSTISGVQGTGLGMAIVKNIIDAAGDHISVESTQGKGTTFTLNTNLILADAQDIKSLPKGDQEEKAFTMEDLKAYFKGRRILLVEDNEFNSTIAYTILENAGFLVETAENGQVAVEKVMTAPVSNYYDVILMDIQMPVMDGYEATKAIRALADERAKVKILAVTANAFETDKENTKEAGMDGHVSKPLDVNNLYQTLLEITDI